MTPQAHLIDDDDAIRDALSWLLKSRQIACTSYASAECFLENWSPELTGCIVLDLRMPGLSGLNLLDTLNRYRSRLPVLFLTGHGNVPLAVAALKKGAFDFFEKPFNDNELVLRIQEAIAHDQQQRSQIGSIDLRLASLTQRERQIMSLVLAGRFNKIIAEELGISMRTVEVHRAHLFEKMGVKTAVELASLLKHTPETL